MPLSNKQLGNTFIQGQNIIIYPSGNSYVISKPDTESYGATGIGVAGVDNWPPSPIYVLPIALQDLSGPNSTMIYKSFSAGTGIGIIDTNNTLIFTASTPTVNGLTSFTSSGTGNILLLSTAITSNTLFYKTLSGTSNLSVNDDSNGTLTFSLAGSGAGTIISGTNVGTGNSFFTGLSTTTNPNDTLAFRNLLAGPNIFINTSIDNDGDILISRGSSILVNQLSNIGGGARVLSSITASNLLVARSLLGASGFSQTIINNASTGETSAITANTVVRIAPTNTTASRLYISDATGQLTTNANFGADTTSGSLSIGAAVSTTSRLLLAAGTGAISQLRLTPFTATTSLIDGDIWYSTTGNTLKFYKNNISTDFIFKNNNNVFTSVTNNKVIQVNTGGTLNSSINYLKIYGFNTISSLTLTNTISEISIISSLLSTGATKTLYNSNSVISDLISGKKFRFNAKGILTTSNSINLTLKIKLGNTIISSSPLIGLTNTLSSAYFEIDTTFTIRTTGATGNVFGSGTIISDQGLTLSIPSNIQPIYENTTTIDTTSDQTFDCTVTFSGTGTILTIYESTLEVLT
jgi:hypothetical protein